LGRFQNAGLRPYCSPAGVNDVYCNFARSESGIDIGARIQPPIGERQTNGRLHDLIGIHGWHIGCPETVGSSRLQDDFKPRPLRSSPACFLEMIAPLNREASQAEGYKVGAAQVGSFKARRSLRSPLSGCNPSARRLEIGFSEIGALKSITSSCPRRNDRPRRFALISRHLSNAGDMSVFATPSGRRQLASWKRRTIRLCRAFSVVEVAEQEAASVKLQDERLAWPARQRTNSQP